MKKIKEVIIDRARWRTGSSNSTATGQGPTMLLNKLGFSCCLGFICRVYKKKTLNMSNPEDIGCSIPYLTITQDNYIVNSELTEIAIRINDGDLPLKEKEKALKKLFKKTIYKLKFIGKPYE